MSRAFEVVSGFLEDPPGAEKLGHALSFFRNDREPSNLLEIWGVQWPREAKSMDFGD